MRGTKQRKPVRAAKPVGPKSPDPKPYAYKPRQARPGARPKRGIGSAWSGRLYDGGTGPDHQWSLAGAGNEGGALGNRYLGLHHSPLVNLACAIIADGVGRAATLAEYPAKLSRMPPAPRASAIAEREELLGWSDPANTHTWSLAWLCDAIRASGGPDVSPAAVRETVVGHLVTAEWAAVER